MGILDRLRDGLANTRRRVGGSLRAVLSAGRGVDESLLSDLEEALLLADAGPQTASKLVAAVRAAARSERLRTAEDVRSFLEGEIAALLSAGDGELARAPEGPTVILVCGVNGSGKTTSIGKLSWLLRQKGHKVVLGAGDTFRAAAVEQLTIWSQRTGVEIVKQAPGAKPDAVAFDACQAAKARGADYVIVDTAGRLHTQKNLMEELAKIRRVTGKAIAGAPHEVLLVLDATTGQNALQQARRFHDAAHVTGLFIAKLDGTAKGGALLAIHDTVGVPVKFVGLGESLEDVQPFDAQAFARALLA